MAESSTFLAELGPTTGPAVYSARTTAGFVTDFGNWGSCLYRGGDYFDARGSWPNQDFDFPESRIDVSPNGWLQFVLADRSGWKPFLVLFGAPAGRKIVAGVSFSVAMPDDYPGFAPDMQWDPVRRTYEVIGPTSDGTSGEVGRPLVIQLRIDDGQQLSFTQAALGWTQLDNF